jgi:hypothetical protein
VQCAYDRTAAEGAAKFFHGLDMKLLDLFCERRAAFCRVCEIRHGPGEGAVYQADDGVDVYGVGNSEQMSTRQLSPYETGEHPSERAYIMLSNSSSAHTQSTKRRIIAR